jgi:hypothetical protein
MKLRIRGSSIRLRLSQGEVATLIAEGAIEESMRFSAVPTDRLTYSVQLSASAPAPSAGHDNGGLLVTLPRALAVRWANSGQTGIEYAQSLGNGSALRIAVEKDFRCLQPRPREDEVDNFPHPDPGSCGSA